jgi:hypothetical protein
MTRDAMLLVDALRDPATTCALDACGWTALIAMARAEQLIGTLAHRLADEAVPPKVAAILADARTNAEYQRRSALWEAECAARALADYPGKVVLLKGTAYVAAGLKAGEGRHIGDLDIMVAREDLAQVEAALIEKGGWEWVKEDAYDDAYYRDHMHELPPLIHKERDRMIDVHHTILPLTARPRPDAAALRGHAIACSHNALGLYVFSPTDMVIHSAAHLFADGDLAGGLRNLWDINCLLTEYDSPNFRSQLADRAKHHQLSEAVERAARLANQLYGTQIPKDWQRWNRKDKWYVLRLTARDHWGRPTRKFIRLIFYIRSHWLRMPPMMLARHLWTKWRKVRA